MTHKLIIILVALLFGIPTRGQNQLYKTKVYPPDIIPASLQFGQNTIELLNDPLFKYQNIPSDKWSSRSEKIALDSIITLNFSNGPIGVNDDKIVYQYNEQQKNTGHISYNWSANENWVAIQKLVHSYYENGMHESTSIHSWKQPGQWEGNNSYKYFYDQQGRVISRIYSKFISELGEWHELNKIDFSYFQSEDYKELLYSNKVIGGNEWTNDQKSVYNRDNTGLLERIDIYLWSNITEEWDYNNKMEYLYDQPDAHIEIISSELDSDENWLPKYRTLRDENENGDNLKSSYFNWNNSTGQWDANYQLSYQYDQFYNRTAYQITYWDENSGDWYSTVNFVTHHNYTVESNEMIFPLEYLSLHKIDSVEIYSRDLPEDDFELYKTDLYFYSDFVNKVEKAVEKAKLIVYPNPFTSHLSFSASKDLKNVNFSLYKMNGELLKNMKIKKLEKIDLGNLAEGNYMYKIKSPNIEYTGVISKIK